MRIKTIVYHRHPTRVVTSMSMTRARCFRATHDQIGDRLRDHRARAGNDAKLWRRQERGKVRVMDSPDKGRPFCKRPKRARTSRKIRRDSTKQIRVIHPGLNNIRFEFDNLLHDSPDETGLRQAAAHAKYLYLRTGGSNLSAQGIMTGEHDHPMFGAVAIRLADQSQEQHFRAAHAESGNDVENLHVPA
jgi:hypothetical protein